MIRTALLSATLLCASLVSAPALAADGTVEFRFTGFRGIYAGGSGVYGRSTVNGQYPTRVGPPVGIDGRGYSYGELDLSGTPTSSVTLQMPEGAGVAPELSPITNVIAFTPRDFAGIVAGENFTLGTISYTNGSWWGTSPNPDQTQPAYLDFEIRTISSTAAFNQVITGAIVLRSRTAISSASQCNGSLAQAQAEADGLSIDSAANLGTDPAFSVYDDFCKPAGSSNTGEVDLIASFGSLDLVGFANPTGGGFISNPDPTDPGTGGVPEPATWGMMILGFGAVGATLRRRARRTGTVGQHSSAV